MKDFLLRPRRVPPTLVALFLLLALTGIAGTSFTYWGVLTAGGLPDSTVVSDDIVDDTLLNADLNAAAAIAPSKFDVSANVLSMLGSADYATVRDRCGVETQIASALARSIIGTTTQAAAINVIGCETAVSASFARSLLGTTSAAQALNLCGGESAVAPASFANAKLALPCLRTISQAIAVGDFTDNAGTATGYLDLTSPIPAHSLVQGWKADVTTGFTGDVKALFELGRTTGLTDFTADATQDGFGVAKFGSASVAATSYTTAATTVRVTVTTDADFTACKTAAAGVATVTIYFVQTE